jgi:hypothetical protein
MRTNIFAVADALRLYGLAYCIYRGFSLWSIFVAWRVIKRRDQQSI